MTLVKTHSKISDYWYLKMEQKTWSVIKFPDEDSVSAVPTSWLQDGGNHCFWPPYNQQQVRLAIERHDIPDEKTWHLYPSTGFRNNIYGNIIVV
ncbi:hypothetical protein RN001_001462 [Aquatica leii]|uniref:Uncharacterized protein n=1 Tax=Aquatica leii TaxID=1421715 RepID=A0AAN7PL87_9COLE|nr:hypothetical protein RN001_001462 [Aquatica leii]